MSGRQLNVGSIENELNESKFFAHKREQNKSKNLRTGEQVSSHSPAQVSKRTGEQEKVPISERTTRASFNIFFEHEAYIDWYIAEKKRTGKKSYNRSQFMRELLDKFFEREKRSGRMKNFSEQVSR